MVDSEGGGGRAASGSADDNDDSSALELTDVEPPSALTVCPYRRAVIVRTALNDSTVRAFTQYFINVVSTNALHGGSEGEGVGLQP